MNDLELIDEIVRRAEEHQKQREKDFAITELEKIKKKIKNDCVLHEEWFADMYDLETLLIDIDEIFDIEISELKGENNE